MRPLRRVLFPDPTGPIMKRKEEVGSVKVISVTIGGMVGRCDHEKDALLEIIMGDLLFVVDWNAGDKSSSSMSNPLSELSPVIPELALNFAVLELGSMVSGSGRTCTRLDSDSKND